MDAKTATEASKMLEAALQQMDGIISSASGNSQSHQCGGGPSLVHANELSNLPSTSTNNEDGSVNILNERSIISADNVLSTAKTLAIALQQVGVNAPAPDPAIAITICDWLESHIPRHDSDERMRRLIRDKESLTLQYQMVADKVCEQSSKILELERILSEKNQQLSAKDELLQKHLCTRSELETQKLELMSALSELKLHRAALEQENLELKKFENLTISQEPLKYFKVPYGSMGNLTQFELPRTSEQSPKTPPTSLRHQTHPLYHSLPRSQCHKNGNKPKLPISPNHNNNIRIINNNSNFSKPRNVAFASMEKVLIDDNSIQNDYSDIMFNSYSVNSNSTPSPTLKERSAKGLRNIFGKLRRSNSGNLEFPTIEQAEPEFRRGDRARATAGGRIEWSIQPTNISTTSSKNYLEWSEFEICSWLTKLGLSYCEEDCRKWLKNQTATCFFTASPMEIERELNLKSTLHRKKIMLAMDELTCKELDPLALKAAQLDIGWVMRWLDDIGLPQYKDTFLQAKIDGRMLHRLTMEDLFNLQVTSCLHIASLRRAIQCMRETEWNPDCLIRRSTKIPKRNSSELEETAINIEELDTNIEFIALWTAHRVMEWLRVADLSEYAPNLRGAGVHGALMLYEPRFNADLLADLLSIPPSKTLLRRHLATHFKDLLGREVIHAKRDVEAQPNYQPLTIAGKIKPPKKTQFSLKRRKSSKGLQCGTIELECTDLVCPLDRTNFTPSNIHNSSTATPGNTTDIMP